MWRNHDHGPDRNVSETTREKIPAETLASMATMQPRLELDGCHFSHFDPWLYPEKV